MAEERAEIQIVTTADQTGAKQTVQAMKEVQAAGTTANKEIAKETEKAGKGAEELRHAIRHASGEFPVLGALGRAAFTPLLGGVILALNYIRALGEDLKRLKESLETESWTQYGSVVAAQKKGFEEAALGASAFARELGRIKTEAQTASEASEKLMEIHKAQMSSAEKVDEAAKKLELAKAEGEQDPVKRQEKVLAIEEKYAARQKKRQDDDAQFQLGEQYRKLANEHQTGVMLDKQLEGARKRRDSLGTEESVNERLRVERERLAKTDDEITKKTERRDELAAKPWLRRSTAEQTEMNYLTEQLEQLGEVRTRQAAYVSLLDKRRPGQIEAIRAAGGDVSALEAERRGVAQRERGIAANLPTETALAGIGAGERGAEAHLGSLTRAYGAFAEAQKQVAEISKEIAKAQQDGHGVNAQLLQTLAEWRAEMNKMKQQIQSLEGARKANPPGI